MNYLNKSLVVMIFLVINSQGSFGHAPLDYATMKPRENNSGVKTTIAGIEDLPCGPGVNAVPGDVQHQIAPGSQFEVVFVETIDHPSKYLIDLTTQDAAADPLSVANPNQVVLHDQDDFYNDAVTPQMMEADGIVILDDARDAGLPRTTTVENPEPDAVYRVMVNIPADVTCDKCTLRLMQKMFDNGNLRTTVYTHCTDVSITANVVDDATPPAAVAPASPTGLKVEMAPRPAESTP